MPSPTRRRAAPALQRQAIQQFREELRVAIDDVLKTAPRRYRLIHFLATHLRRVWLIGRLLERIRVKSYEKRVKPRVQTARRIVEAGLPRRYRRALRGDRMAPSVRRP